MPSLCLLSCAAAVALAVPVGAQPRAVTVLHDGATHRIERALVAGARLLVPAADLAKVSGFELKAEGICAGSLCIPVPPDGGWVRTVGETRYVDATAVASHVDQVVVPAADGAVWAFSRVPAIQRPQLVGARAPDFTLLDRSGETVSLSDFRGKKVLLLTWASW